MADSEHIDDERLRTALVLSYHQTKDLMADGPDEEIRRLVEENDLVYGVWSDTNQPRDIDYKLLKGDESRMHNKGRIGLACESVEQADHIKVMFCTPDL